MKFRLCVANKMSDTYISLWPVPVAARSKAWVCGRSLAETVGLNTAGGMDVCCECCLCCQVEVCATG